MFKSVDHKICGIDLGSSSTAFGQNNIHKTTHLQGHCKAFYVHTSFLSSVITKENNVLMKNQGNASQSIIIELFSSCIHMGE